MSKQFSIIPTHIVVKRYQEARDDCAMLRYDSNFQRSFETTIKAELERISKLVSCKMATQVDCESDPYDCYDSMYQDVLLNGRLRMKNWRKAHLPVPIGLYSAMRAVHDLHHVLLNLPFDWENENIAFHLLSQSLKQYDPNPNVLNYIRNELYNVAMVIEGYEPLDKVVLEDLLYE